MAESQHDSANAHVKREEAATRSMEGRAPMMGGRYMEFDACMMNNGAHAQKFVHALTKGLDEKAFPIRPGFDPAQE
jgi:hypothetical protein